MENKQPAPDLILVRKIPSEFVENEILSRLKQELALTEAAFLDRFQLTSEKRKPQLRQNYAIALVDGTARAFMGFVEAGLCNADEYLKLLEVTVYGPIPGVDWESPNMRSKVMARNRYWYSVALRIERENWHECVEQGAQATEPSAPCLTANSAGADRRGAVNAYIAEVLRETQKSITYADIWRTAGDHSRAEFERWMSAWYEERGRKTNRAADERFRRVLTQKPHLK